MHTLIDPLELGFPFVSHMMSAYCLKWISPDLQAFVLKRDYPDLHVFVYIC